jgi:hypothetical protein
MGIAAPRSRDNLFDPKPRIRRIPSLSLHRSVDQEETL